MSGRNKSRNGHAVLEFTLVGIPVLFLLISITEIARGMWNYHTLAHAVKEGTRYTIVHGANCANGPNTCGITIGQIASRVQNSGVGLLSDDLTLTFTASSTTLSCQINNCLGDSTPWPPATENECGMDVQITGAYTFRSALCMFWPGSGSGINLGTLTLPASSQGRIQF